MGAQRLVSTVLVGCFVALAVIAAGETPKEAVAAANIPFEFFVGSDRMPEGDYTISHISPTIFVFHNKKTGSTAQAFVAWSADPVSDKDKRLVFVWFKGQYRFVGMRGTQGTWRATAYYSATLPEGASRRELPFSYIKP